MKTLAINPRRFFLLSLAVLFVSVCIHLLFNVREYISIASYPHQEIFYEDSVTVAGGEVAAKGRTKLVPVGITVGVRFYTDGILILSTDKVNSALSPSDGKLMSGDVLLKADGTAMLSLSQLVDAIDAAGDTIDLEIKRDSKLQQVKITPARDADGNRKIGCWVRDSTQGIGTITYYNPATSQFGALGHGIMDVDTQKLMAVRHGQIMESNIIDVRKGKKGAPGELIGEIRSDCIIGEIKKNTRLGIYGNISQNYKNLPAAAFFAARHDQIHQGPAKIFSNIEGGNIKAYDAYIESVNADATADKGMVVRITDQGLITRSGGIVQGMSGSPILQGDKLIGAVTHVFVQNPLRGYGVFIEKMMAEEKEANKALADAAPYLIGLV